MVASTDTGEILVANSLAEQLFGYDSDELSGRSLEALGLELRDEYTRLIEAQAADQERGGATRELALIGIRKDGRELPIAMSLGTVDWQGKAAVLGTVRDVTALQADPARESAQERYHQLFDSLPAPLCLCDKDGYIMAATELWLELLGHRRSYVTGRHLREFLSDESRPYVETILYPRISSAGRITNEPIQFLRKDGERVAALLSAVRKSSDDGHLQVLIALTDVTEQKRLEHELLARSESERPAGPLVTPSYGLTKRENTILRLLADGKADKEIATELDISPNTVSKHVASILLKMDVSSRTEASVRALKEGLLN